MISKLVSTLLYLLCGCLLEVTLSEVACNYVKFNADVQYSFLSYTLGTFSFSTDRCQSLRAHIDLGDYYHQVVDGSVLFTCSKDSKTLKLKVYDDPTCTNKRDSLSVKTNDSVTISDYVKFHIDELHCDLVDCDVGFTFTQNCSWLNSQLYLNVSLPPEQCLSFGADFQGILSVVPDEILPDDVVDDLDEKSYKYSCCEDNSLLIYNYTDTKCKNEYNMIRVSSDYNGTCFKTGDTSWYDSDDSEEYKFVLQWTCAKYADCDAMGIDFLDDKLFPDKCNKKCLDGLDWDGTGTNSHHHKDDTNDGSDGGNVTVTKETIIGIAVGVLLLFIFSLIAVYCFTRRRRIQRELEKQEEIIVSPEKYAPMIGDDDIDAAGDKKSKFSSKISNMVKGNKNDNESTEIVYHDDNVSSIPSALGSSLGSAGVQHTNEEKPVSFASMTSNMTIDDQVHKDEINDLHDDIADVKPLNAGVEEAHSNAHGNGHIPLKEEEDDE